MTCILCCYILVLFYCFNIGMSFFTLACNGYVYETFGISKHFPVKLQVLLIRAEMLDNPLTAKCFIYDVTMRFYFLSFTFSISSTGNQSSIFPYSDLSILKGSISLKSFIVINTKYLLPANLCSSPLFKCSFG